MDDREYEIQLKDQDTRSRELALKEAELVVKQQELELKRVEARAGAYRFVIGTLLLGVLGIALNVGVFLHAVRKDDREYLERNMDLLQEQDPTKLLANVKMLRRVGQPLEEALNATEQYAQATIALRKQRIAEDQARIDRENAERQLADRAKLDEARRRELSQIAAREVAARAEAEARRKQDEAMKDLRAERLANKFSRFF
jgi:hypothetical protein